MQDISRIYVGCRYTLGELIDTEEVPFKLRMLVERYILPEADPEDTLETHLYYLEPGSFLVKIYARMKAKVKVNIIEERHSMEEKHSMEERHSIKERGSRFPAGRTGKAAAKKEYVTKLFTIEQLVQIPPAEKERQGLVVQELSVSKLALAGM